MGFAPAPPEFQHVGQWPNPKQALLVYLTAEEQEELFAVARDDPMAETLAVATAVKRTLRFRRLDEWNTALTALSAFGALISAFTWSLWAVVAFIIMFGISLYLSSRLRASKQPGDDVIQELLRAIREVESADFDHGRSCRRVDFAAFRFYEAFPRARGRNGRKTTAPHHHRVNRESQASLGADAIASQARLLDADQPNTHHAADALRLAVLAIADGRWREVSQLDASGGDPLWNRRPDPLSADEVTKLIGLLAAILGLAAAVIALVKTIVWAP